MTEEEELNDGESQVVFWTCSKCGASIGNPNMSYVEDGKRICWKCRK